MIGGYDISKENAKKDEDKSLTNNDLPFSNFYSESSKILEEMAFEKQQDGNLTIKRPTDTVFDALPLMLKTGVDTLKDQTDKEGSRYVGLCPFHDEKHPSFYVTPSKGIFKCFGCGKVGDVINFIQEINGLTYYIGMAAIFLIMFFLACYVLNGMPLSK